MIITNIIIASIITIFTILMFMAIAIVIIVISIIVTTVINIIVIVVIIVTIIVVIVDIIITIISVISIMLKREKCLKELGIGSTGSFPWFRTQAQFPTHPAIPGRRQVADPAHLHLPGPPSRVESARDPPVELWLLAAGGVCFSDLGPRSGRVFLLVAL